MKGSKKNIRAKRLRQQTGLEQIPENVSLVNDNVRKLPGVIILLVVAVRNGVGVAGRHMQIYGELGIVHTEEIVVIMHEVCKIRNRAFRALGVIN